VLSSCCSTRCWRTSKSRLPRSEVTPAPTAHAAMPVRQLHKLEMVGETVRAAPTASAAAPKWLEARIKPEWVERYGHRVEDYHTPGKSARDAYAPAVAEDYAPLDASRLQHAARASKPVWSPASLLEQSLSVKTKIRWRTASELKTFRAPQLAVRPRSVLRTTEISPGLQVPLHRNLRPERPSTSLRMSKRQARSFKT